MCGKKILPSYKLMFFEFWCRVAEVIVLVMDVMCVLMVTMTLTPLTLA